MELGFYRLNENESADAMTIIARTVVIMQSVDDDAADDGKCGDDDDDGV